MKAVPKAQLRTKLKAWKRWVGQKVPVPGTDIKRDVDQIPPYTFIVDQITQMHHYCGSNTPYTFTVDQIPPTPLYYGSNTPHSFTVDQIPHIFTVDQIPHTHLYCSSNTPHIFTVDQIHPPPPPLLWIKNHTPPTHTHTFFMVM